MRHHIRSHPKSILRIVKHLKIGPGSIASNLIGSNSSLRRIGPQCLFLKVLGLRAYRQTILTPPRIT
jgi:hypothetical protein